MKPPHVEGEPFADTNAIFDVLRDTSTRLKEADRLMSDLEDQQREMIQFLHQLAETAVHLELERDQWKKRALEAEQAATRAEARAGEMETRYRESARLAAELGYRLGEVRCPDCGSDQLALLHGNFPTGVTAPDGGAEVWFECALDCQKCGYRQELVP